MSINNTSAGLILESPFTSITDLGKKKFPIFPISLILKDRFDNESKFERLSVPLFVMHGNKDKIVPQNMSFRLTKLKKPTVTYFPENDNTTSLFDKYKNKIFTPSSEEVKKNPPSRSAKLRYAIRNKNKFCYPDELEIKFKKYLDLESIHV